MSDTKPTVTVKETKASKSLDQAKKDLEEVRDELQAARNKRDPADKIVALKTRVGDAVVAWREAKASAAVTA